MALKRGFCMLPPPHASSKRLSHNEGGSLAHKPLSPQPASTSSHLKATHVRVQTETGEGWLIVGGGCTLVLEKTLESPLDCKEIQPVHPKGDQSWVFIGRTDAEAETPILWPTHVKS